MLCRMFPFLFLVMCRIRSLRRRILCVASSAFFEPPNFRSTSCMTLWPDKLFTLGKRECEGHSACRDAMNASAWAMAVSMSRTSLSTLVCTLTTSSLSPAIALAFRLCFMNRT